MFSKKQDKIIRRLIPSTVLLARSPFGYLLDVFDNLYKKRYPEYGNLPPASLRLRVGTGNKILRNHAFFNLLGESLVKGLIDKQYLKQNSLILEIGCGCGRIAIPLVDFLGEEGNYTGVDVDKEMIDWCQEKIQSDRFKFEHIDVYNSVYNPRGMPMVDFNFPILRKKYTFVITSSLFTHLLYKEMNHYFGEVRKVLDSAGYFHMTFFILDYMDRWLGGRWNFAHKMENCRVENIKYPAAAVGYELEVVRETLSMNDFSIVEIFNKNSPQQTIIAR